MATSSADRRRWAKSVLGALCVYQYERSLPDLQGCYESRGLMPVEDTRLASFLEEAESDVCPNGLRGHLVMPRLSGKQANDGPLFPLLSLVPIGEPGEKLMCSALETLSLEVVLWNRDHECGCIAFRLEPPSRMCYASGQEGKHDYYHMQFVSEPRAARVEGKIWPAPMSQPAFPLQAEDFGSLIFGLMVALYGRGFENDTELDLEPATRARLGLLYAELGYWKPPARSGGQGAAGKTER